jgi:hypothetical protein
MLNETGRRDPAVERMVAEFSKTNNTPAGDLYAEVAMLYFWVSKDNDQTVRRRMVLQSSRADPDTDEPLNPLNLPAMPH